MKKPVAIIMLIVMSFSLVFLPVSVLAQESQDTGQSTIKYTIKNNVLNKVDNNIFGQFLEKNSTEPGPEAILASNNGDIQPKINSMLHNMQIPIIRFPGGTDVDYIDWTDMIDNVPEREGRPDSKFTLWDKNCTMTNAYGYDEFLKMAGDLKSEPLLVVNFRDGLTGKKPLEEAAMDAAGLVAYCNAEVGAGLPAGMIDWPSIRKENGHSQPYKVKYFQIGNEIWSYLDQSQDIGYNNKEKMSEWFIKCLCAYIDAMRSVDPDIKILMDGNLNMDGESFDITSSVLNNSSVQSKVDYLAYSYYKPLDIYKAYKGTREYQVGKLTDEEAWQAAVAMPDLDKNGESIIPSNYLPPLKSNGQRWKCVFTEWNCEGYNLACPKMALNNFHSQLACGVGAAGFLNAFIRDGNNIDMATQSALICTNWEIGSIRIDSGTHEPYYSGMGLATMLYTKYHGNKRLEMEEENVPVYTEPFSFNQPIASQRVAVIDAVATSSDKAIYFHVINRDYSNPYSIEIDLSGLSKGNGKAIIHTLTGRLNDKPSGGQSLQVANIQDSLSSEINNGILTVTIPEKSVSVIEIPLGGTSRPISPITTNTPTSTSTPSTWAASEVAEAVKYGLATDSVLKDFQSNLTREEFCELAVNLYEKLSGKTAEPASADLFTDTRNPKVLKAYNLGITKGTSSGLFSPSNPITRQEICCMIYRTLKAAVPDADFAAKKAKAFADADKINDWALDSLYFCFENEIMKGVTKDSIDPDGYTSKEQGIIMMKRAYLRFSGNR